MNEKITIQDIAGLIAEKHGMDINDAELFVKGIFDLIESALASEKYVKVKGLGIFKLTEVDSRESVNIHTGERIEIQGHTKITFTPDASMKELINKPFAHFETVVLNENTELADTVTEIEGEETEEEASETEATAAADKGNGPMTEAVVPEEKEAVEEETLPAGSQEDKERKTAPWGMIAAVVLMLCLLAGIFWYMQSTSGKAPTVSASNPEPAATATPSDKDTASVANRDSVVEMPVAQPQTTPAGALEQPAVAADNQGLAKVTLADTVEYDIAGTKTSHTLQEGESIVKLAVKFYGTKKLWPYIVKYNKELIKDANKVPVGTVLRIPELTPKKQ